ncbi:hypothetical protein [Xenorhabdus koppenhoeferi]|nr:hypothetical protein [Xenorhabdus koppenhoeferi]
MSSNHSAASLPTGLDEEEIVIGVLVRLNKKSVTAHTENGSKGLR